jgi:subtilisin family serine protease
MTSFPDRLPHGSGAYMDLVASRLLLATRVPMGLDEVGQRLSETGLGLEGSGEDSDARRMRRVNHTDTRFWLRSNDDEPVGEDRMGLLRELFGDQLAWIGPVYRLSGATRGDVREAMLSPLTNVLLVRERKGTGPTIQRAAASAADVSVAEDRDRTRMVSGYRYYVIENPERVNAFELRDRLLEVSDRIADIRFEHMPMLVPTAAIPNDPLFGQQWNMTQIAAPAGWDISTGAASVVVCVLDQGCDLTHPDLVYAGTGINLGSMSGDGSPTGPHGTACAGIVAATFDNGAGVAGVAGDCEILPAAFVAWSDVEVAAGINWATANGADVISMSFGWNGWDPMIIDPAIQAAFTAGLVMCVATHNDNGAIRYPATNPLVMAVGASDQADERKSPMSPDGECWGSNFGPEISAVAPGVRVPTTDIQGAGGYNDDGSGGMWACMNYASFGDAAGDYVTVFDGTSAATPHVAGLAALLLSAYPSLTNIDVRTIIESTADKVGATAYAETPGNDSGTWNQNMGYGRINVHKALDLADVMIRDWPGDTGAEPSAPSGGNFWNFADIVVRIFDDDVFVPSDPTQSQYLELGQTNYLYVRVRNDGPRTARNVTVSARLTPYVGTQFVYPTDWTNVDGTHLEPTAITSSFASIPAGGEEITKFSISQSQVAVLHSNNWHPCLVALVTADNDHAFASAAFTASPVVVRRNNLAQRNLSVINVLAGATASFPFIAGHSLNDQRFLELVVNRANLPRDMVLELALDGENTDFPHVDVDKDVVDRPRDDECGCGGLVFLDRTRVRTHFGCCVGVLTLERGSRLDCARSKRVGAVTVTGGDVTLRDGARYVRIVEDISVIRLEKSAGQLLPLALSTVIPGGGTSQREFEVSVAQRDEDQQVVGGATVLFVRR